MAPWGDLDERRVSAVSFARLTMRNSRRMARGRSSPPSRGRTADGAGESQLQCFGALARLWSRRGFYFPLRLSYL